MPDRRLRVVWSPEAEQDLIEVWGYVAREASPEIAGNQLRSIDQACQTLSEWPHSGRARDEILSNLRSAVAHPYVIFYRASPASIEVVRVVHGRRDIEVIFDRER